MTIGGHDPSGGAGIQADIETIGSLGGIAVSAVSCLTLQDTKNVYEMIPVDSSFLSNQLRTIVDDIDVEAIKLGALGSESAVDAVSRFIDDRPGMPVILDPVLAAGGGKELSTPALVEAIRTKMLDHTFLITPNSVEARRLSGQSTSQDAARWLVDQGVQNVLITGGHEPGETVTNVWWDAEGEQGSWQWPRLQGSYHGSGCTLASACATLIARGLPLKLALRLAQAFTHDALVNAHRPGKGQAIPRRILPAPPRSPD